jgi:hypothetical protein
MANFYEPVSDIQQSAIPGRSAEPGSSVSDDSRFSLAETARLEAAAQQAIDQTRHDTVGSAP